MSSGPGLDEVVSPPEEIRVLHVEDDAAFADLVATYLERERESFTVVTETDPREVLDRLEETPVDCVVSDYEMPHLDGLDVLEAIRERYPDLPFVLFTGQGSEEIASEAISAGVTEYLQKRGGIARLPSKPPAEAGLSSFGTLDLLSGRGPTRM